MPTWVTSGIIHLKEAIRNDPYVFGEELTYIKEALKEAENVCGPVEEDLKKSK